MIFDRYQLRLVLRVILLFIVLGASSFFLIKGFWLYLLLSSVIIIFQMVDFYRFNRKAQDEVQQFVESVHYRDFSRYFDVKQAPLELQPLRKGFNEINTTFKVISREKETQYVYLQKILELVDTGILSYENKSGEVGWMNESLKKMLGIPYLRTVHSMQKRDEALYKQILNLKNGENKLVSVTQNKTIFKILLSAT